MTKKCFLDANELSKVLLFSILHHSFDVSVFVSLYPLSFPAVILIQLQ